MSYTVYLLLNDGTIYTETVATWSCAQGIFRESDVLAYQVYELIPGDKRARLYECGGRDEYDLVNLDKYLELQRLNANN